MRPVALIGSALPLLFSAASAQDEVQTVCGNERLGTEQDTLMYFPNAWNVQSPDDGYICLKVNNATPAFSATWDFEKNIEDVYAFPYVRLNDGNLPMKLSDIHSIRLSTEWMYARGKSDEITTDFSEATFKKNNASLQGNTVQANAAWDFFMDDDRNSTMYPQVAAVECMVWLGKVGDPWWHGRKENAILTNVTVGGKDFTVYYGKNAGGTHVFSTVAVDGAVLSLDADFSPLFNYILEEAREHPLVSGDLPKNPYLGIVEFGSEIWLSDGPMTFTASNFSMTINDPADMAKNNTDPHNSGSDHSDDPPKKTGGSNSTNAQSDNTEDDNEDDDDAAMALLDKSALRYTLAFSLAIGLVWSI